MWDLYFPPQKNALLLFPANTDKSVRGFNEFLRSFP
jgi:hypothetical protein